MYTKVTRRLFGCFLTILLLTHLSPTACDFYAKYIYPALHRARYGLRHTFLHWPWILLPISLYKPKGITFRRFLCRRLSELLILFALLWLPLYGAALPSNGTSVDWSAEATRLIESLNQESDSFPTDTQRLSEWITQATEEAQAFFACTLDMPKAVSHCQILNALGIAGCCDPFSTRCLINADDRALLIPFTICHELAHQVGYARESDANAAAYFLCIRLGGVFEASAQQQMLLYALKSLTDAERMALLPQMNQAVQHEIITSNGLYSETTSPLQRLFCWVNDCFLRLCGDPNGINSYQAVWQIIIPQRP